MATRGFVPNADNEGSIGTTLKKWASGFFTAITATTANVGVVIVTDGAGHYLKLPELTETQRDALTPDVGMFIYNATQNRSELYENGAWVPVTQTDDAPVYGFLWNTKSSNPTLINCDQNGDTLLLNGTNFDHHPLWGNIKRCSLTAAGVATYGSDNKGTGLTTTSDYMMVEIPQVHVMAWTDGDYRGFALCNEAFTGKPGAGTEISSSVHPWFNQRGGSLATPCTKGYVGAYKASDNGGTSLSSKSGVAPLANIDMATFEARGNAIGSNWGITNVWYQSLLQLLMYTEFGTLNIQSALAPGFTKSTNTAPQTCGTNDSLMGTNGTGGGTDVQGVNYRGINNPYGDMWEFRIGWNSVDAEYRVLNRDGSGTIAATLASGSYEATSGVTPLTGVNGYASGVLNVDPLKLMFVPSAISGSETTYLCDYFYGHTSGQTGCLVAGGHWHNAGYAGPGSLYAHDAVSNVGSSIGARVEFLGVTS